MPAALDTLHLLLPFSLPARTVASAAAAGGQRSAFSRFIARARWIERVYGEAFARTPPHLRWLAHCFSVAENQAFDDPPFAPYMQLADRVDAGARIPQAISDIHGPAWACIEPVHVRIAHDHLVLMEPTQLALLPDEAAQLLNAARPVIAMLGFTLETPTPMRWYVQASALTTLNCASPQAAAGRNLEIWLPFSPETKKRSLTWMKLQNEVQMAWFEHPVNRAREARGAWPVNSIWLHASGCLKTVTCPFSRVYSNQMATRGLGFAAHAAVAPPPTAFGALSAQSTAALVELDILRQAFIERDWTAWCAAWAALECNWFAPAWAALRNGTLRTLTLTLTGEVSSWTLTATRADIYKFWRRRPVESLFE